MAGRMETIEGNTGGNNAMNRRNIIWKAILAGMLLISTGKTAYAEEPDPASTPPVGEEAIEEPVTEETSAETEESMPNEETTPEESPTAEPTESSEETLPQEKPEPVPEPSEGPADAEAETETEVNAEPETETETILPSAEPEENGEPEETAEPEPMWSDRLIVIGGEIRDQDHVISAYEDLTLLGFANGDALQEGYAYYSVHAAHAEADGVILAAENGDLTDAPNEISSENNPIDQLQQLLEEGPSLPAQNTPLIALIDTGAPQNCANILSAVSVLGEDPYDDNGHGSRMSELILAENPAARILSIKALDASGKGTMSSVYAAMEYAMEQGADMIALCMSAYVNNENRIIADEIAAAAAKGITVVGAAGNNHLNTKYFIPANCSDAVIAASCDEAGELKDFSNWGETVDALVVSDSTSEAAAILCGILSENGMNLMNACADARVFVNEPGSKEGETPESTEDDSFYSQCNTFFYGDAYYWEIPYGETSTANAVLIPGHQQETLSSKSARANGYDVQFQDVADDTFSPGHGYAVFASTHKESAVSSWGSDVHEDEYRGSFEAWGQEFDSARDFSIRAKSIPNYGYQGMVVSQNSTAKPSARAVTSLDKGTTASVRLGEVDAVYWKDVPGVNEDYWKGWENTSSGDAYHSFRVDFYYMNIKPRHKLTVHYLEEGTNKQLAKDYGPTEVLEGDAYSVTSPNVADYELVDPKQAVIRGNMPNHDVVYTVYYRRVYKILTKVINGTITLNNEMEKAGTTGDATWMASGRVTGIHAGENRTIRYANKPDHLLDYVKVDGKPVDITNYPDRYPFTSVSKDHTVEVRYAPYPVSDDSKKVQRSDGTYIDGKMVTAGEVLTYTINVKNHFSTAQTFRAEDRIPERTSYVEDSANENGALEDGVLRWSFTLEGGAEKNLSFKVTVLPDAKDTIVKNKAEVFMNGMTFTTNETENPVLPDPVKRVENKEGEDRNGFMVPIDQEVWYRITVKNPGSKELEFTITDPVDEGQSVTSASISDGGTLNGSVITWKIRVPAGNEYTVSFAAIPKDLELTIPNKAGVTSGGCPVIETNETIIYTPAKPVKEVTTTGGTDIDGKAIAENEEFLYWITVTNPCAAEKEYQITDTIPSAVQIIDAGSYSDQFVSGGASAAISGQTVTWNTALPGMEELHCYVRCRLTASNVSFTNQARALTDGLELWSNEVSNWAGRIIINAEIEDYWEPYGQPSFLYDIQDGSGRMWHRMIVIDPSSRIGQAVFDIPTGHDEDTWVITDEPGSRYRFLRAYPETGNVSVAERTSTVTITRETNLGITHYVYGIEHWKDTAHLAAVTNSLAYARS